MFGIVGRPDQELYSYEDPYNLTSDDEREWYWEKEEREIAARQKYLQELWALEEQDDEDDE